MEQAGHSLPRIEFHTGVDDPVAFACLLLRRACKQGVRVHVTAPPDVLDALDNALWQMDEREFLPHVRVPGSSAAVAARTPIWLSNAATAPDVPRELDAPRVLLNVGADPAVAHGALGTLERLIEVVATDADLADAGRRRWSFYKAAGFQIHHQPASGAGTTGDA